MSERPGLRSGARAAFAVLALAGAIACSGADGTSLLTPPRGSGTTDDDASTSKHPGGNPGSIEDAAVVDATSQSSDDDASQNDDADDAAPPDDAGESPPPGAEPASPCPACGLGTTCCANAGSSQYGTCYSVLCFGLCCS
jgi:hypothetical protein